MEELFIKQIMDNRHSGFAVFSEKGEHILSNELFELLSDIKRSGPKTLEHIFNINLNAVKKAIKDNGFFAENLKDKKLLLFILPFRYRLKDTFLVLLYREEEEEIYTNRELMDVFVKKSPVGFFIYKDTFVFSNRTFEKILEYGSDELKKIRPYEIVEPKVREKIKKVVQERLSGRKMEKYYELLTVISKSGKEKHIELITTTIKYKGDYAGAGVCIDRTEKVDLERKLNYLYLYDELTGLPNRRYFIEKLKSAIEYAKKNNHFLALLIIDVVEFKLINKKFGYKTGDKILVEIGERLKNLALKTDVVSRTGDDKFSILIYSFKSYEKLTNRIEIILKALKKEFKTPEVSLFLEFKIGVSIFPKDGVYPEELFKNCELALLKAKKTAGKEMEFFSKNIDREISRILHLKETIRKLIEKNHVIVHYQPIVNLLDRKIYAAESLFRISTDDGKIILPKDIIPVAEETGLITDLGEKIIQTATGSGKELNIPVSVNISAVQLNRPNFDSYILDILHSTGFPPENLILEITESSLIENISENIEKLKILKENGVKVAIDDFGTGYSSLSYLKNIPLDFLKIDISFIRGIGRDEKDEMIIRTIISMAKHLRVLTIAEGIENETQLRFLIKSGANLGQGFYFYRPLEIAELKRLISGS
ncbi:EAL domain-containing protein [Persephonella atlantica]|uniref:EAL domain-containing protein n=1 Tax=Persephonella atlantica TaxID=2699429 RepID=A0ABS1GF27_9AQUI|nr:bifunctional diguanylate cyclase/phosphodiesterase [Persephonella atlantica]MBK3331522.1 EAL domain-containing protein [Persephonella atlantica]